MSLRNKSITGPHGLPFPNFHENSSVVFCNPTEKQREPSKEKPIIIIAIVTLYNVVNVKGHYI